MKFEYDSREGFASNLKIMYEKLKGHKKLFFIAHSLGGIYSLNLAHRFPSIVLGAVTLSTPYGGVEAADYAKYFFPFNRLIRDVGPHSLPILNTCKLTPLHPWTQVVTTKGSSPWIHAPNDGVVTVSSQQHIKDMELIELEVNHYEVVMNSKVIEIIKERLILN